MSDTPTRPLTLLGRRSWSEASRIAGILRQETVGGVLLLAGALSALAWANSPWSDSYESLRGYVIGPSALHLDLNLATWAADGLLVPSPRETLFDSTPTVSLAGEALSLIHPPTTRTPR